jgi:hypothetical protein
VVAEQNLTNDSYINKTTPNACGSPQPFSFVGLGQVPEPPQEVSNERVMSCRSSSRR